MLSSSLYIMFFLVDTCILFFFNHFKKLKAIEACWQALELRYYLIINPAIVKALN